MCSDLSVRLQAGGRRRRRLEVAPPVVAERVGRAQPRSGGRGRLQLLLLLPLVLLSLQDLHGQVPGQGRVEVGLDANRFGYKHSRAMVVVKW